MHKKEKLNLYSTDPSLIDKNHPVFAITGRVLTWCEIYVSVSVQFGHYSALYSGV